MFNTYASLSLRPANESDIEILRFWDEQPHKRAVDPYTDWQWESELRRQPDWREQLIAEHSGQPIGFIRIIDPSQDETGRWDGFSNGHRAVDIWLGEPAHLGRGLGSNMMRHALNRCFENPEVKSVLVDPLATNTPAHRFYERLGFHYVERRMIGGDDCFLYELCRPQRSETGL
ncbi:MAG: GNAT family N-acetyltransferase [Gammaproteobacteria bacterium]